ncbi:MAG: arylsulfatase [Armatimonadetes bacterium]|nr:arylsulfatase [Armatimonadota bacterium]
MPDRRAFLATTAMLAATRLRAAKPPNIVFILTDDQGYGDLSCHGNPILRTPNIDRIHRDAVRLTEFHVSPTCAPTRCTLMTGRHEFRSGVTHTILERERMALSAATLPEMLRRAGYTTGIFGKWHLGDEDAYLPERRGFDEVYIHGGGGIGQSYPGSCGDAPGNTYFSPTLWHNGRFEKTDGYCTDLFFGAAERWVGQVRGKQPFFAYITPNVPHGPLQVRDEDLAVYRGKVPDNTAKFFGMIHNLDQNVGRLLDALTRWDLDRDTLVVFMTDNGGTAGLQVGNDGMRTGKGTAFRGGTRVPSFWRWTGTLTPGDRPQLAGAIDVLPTLAELVGAQPAQPVDGRSLLPLLRDPAAAWPDRLLYTHVGRWERGQAAGSKYRQCRVRAPRWELVSNSRTTEPAWQLYDIFADPGERTDLATRQPAVVAELAAAYDRWWESILPGLVNEEVTGPAENPYRTRYEQQFGKA